MQTIRIAIDAMGGDYGPHFAINAALALVAKNPKVELIIFLQEGHPEPDAHPRIQFRFCPAVISMNDKPADIIRTSLKSTMLAALHAVKAGEADVCVSSGNTGALMALSLQQLAMIKGFSRPVIATLLPADDSGRLAAWLDLGANIDCNQQLLLQFARLGLALAQARGVSNPQVSLLNIATEPGKGSKVLKKAHELFKSELASFNGFIEPSHMYQHNSDVIVCDGFHGNLVLKASEAAAQHILAFLPEDTQSEMRQRLAPEYNSGAYLLGLESLVVKTHGNSQQQSWYSALCFASQGVEQQLTDKISRNSF